MDKNGQNAAITAAGLKTVGTFLNRGKSKNRKRDLPKTLVFNIKVTIHNSTILGLCDVLFWEFELPKKAITRVLLDSVMLSTDCLGFENLIAIRLCVRRRCRERNYCSGSQAKTIISLFS